MRALVKKSLKVLLVNFFSGFSLSGEEFLFRDYIKRGEFTVCGFSLGAIRAFESVYEGQKRVDTLQLFSPAFFQDRDEKFKRLQKISYQKNQTNYEREFLKNISHPSNFKMQEYFKKDDINSLEKLLSYNWQIDKLKELQKRGIKIEVYLGSEDKIINTEVAYEFFKTLSTVYFIKKVGHILNGKS